MGMRGHSWNAICSGVAVMSRPDRRHPRVTVQQLRWDLRDADRDRFQVRSALARVRRAPTVAGLLILIGGFASAFWTAEAPSPVTRIVNAAGSVEAIPLNLPALTPPAVEAIVLGRAGVSSAKPRRAIPRTVTIHRNQVAQLRVAEPTRRTVPRPLHPGEFGLKSDRIDDTAETPRSR
jgi:hypothetical protein